ncbi:MAG: TetR/AcrR family transcriptional regulator [Gammaproteobacteria bacterium]|nr:TetR/AcrR family transcriptional regulator [Gammaproteobacteria bacterium]
MTKTKSTPAEPVQERSRQTMNRILDAAEALLKTSSIDRIGIAEITASAGVAAGSFYTRFADKEDLLEKLFERYLDDLRSVAAEIEPELVAEPVLEKRLARVIDAVTGLFATRRGVVRSMLMKIRHDPDYQSPELMNEFQAFYDRAGELLVGDGSEVKAQDKAAAGRFCMQIIASYCRDAILFEEFPVQMNTPSRNPAFKSALYKACLGVLEVQGSD